MIRSNEGLAMGHELTRSLHSQRRLGFAKSFGLYTLQCILILQR
jgi:hypothetical protein